MLGKAGRLSLNSLSRIVSGSLLDRLCASTAPGMSFFTDFQDPQSQLQKDNAVVIGAQSAAASASTSTSIADHLDVVEEGFADSSEGDDFAAALADLRATDSKDAGDVCAPAEAKAASASGESKGWKEVAEGRVNPKASVRPLVTQGIDETQLKQTAGRLALQADDKLTEVQKSNTTSTLYVLQRSACLTWTKFFSVSMSHQMLQAPEDDSTDFVLQLTAKMEGAFAASVVITEVLMVAGPGPGPGAVEAL